MLLSWIPLACSGGDTTPPEAPETADTATTAPTGSTSETGEGSTGSTATTADTAPPVDRFDDFVNVTDPPTSSGSLACWSPSQPFWTATLEPTAQGPHVVSTGFMDWERHQPISGTIEVFSGDVLTPTPDLSWPTGGTAGVAEVVLPTCTPVTVRTTTDGTQPPSRVTLTPHELIRVAPYSQSFRSFSEASHAAVHAAYGVTPLPGYAMVAGTLFDCIGAPVANLQVLARDENGIIPPDLSAHYYGYDGWWDPAQAWTEAYDGRFFLLNLPAGPATIEVWGFIGGSYVLVASTEIEAVADSVVLKDLTFGTSDGLVVPWDCL